LRRTFASGKVGHIDRFSYSLETIRQKFRDYRILYTLTDEIKLQKMNEIIGSIEDFCGKKNSTPSASDH
jgi:hypothetical protein